MYKNFSEKSWNDYMHLAWTCHPMIALALARRVRNSGKLYVLLIHLFKVAIFFIVIENNLSRSMLNDPRFK